MAASMSNAELRPETIAAHSLKSIDEATGAVVPPIYMSTTYARDETYTPKLKENYIRNGNPTLWHAENALAALERGEEALLFTSGMAAITTLFETVPQGGHVVAPAVMYYGTRDWLQRLASLGRISLTLFDAVKPGGLDAALSRQDRHRVDRDAAQSDVGCDRYRGGGASGAQGGRHSRRRCDGHGGGDDTAACNSVPTSCSIRPRNISTATRMSWRGY